MRKSLKNILTCLSSSIRRTRGYTLIEMAITVGVVGGMIAIIAPAVNIYLKHQAVQTTLDNASLITGALNAYLVQHGAYPCPARMNAARTDPDYGFAGDCTDKSVPSPPLPALPAPGSNQVISAPYGGCGNGYCVQMSDRIWDTPPNPQLAAELANNWDGRVRRGAVPFRDLGIQEYVAEDGYKNRFIYAVTENLAVKAKYDRNLGGIDIVNEEDISGQSAEQGIHQSNNLCGPGAGHPVHPKEFCMGGGPVNNTYYKRLATAPADVPNTLTSVGGAVHYVIISAGPDGAGAYSHEGLIGNPCPGTFGTLDALNCFMGPESSMPPAVYRAASYSEAPGANHFDDTVKFYSSVEIPLWQVAGASGLDLADLAGAGDDPAKGKVGIDTNPGTIGGALQVNSDVVAEKNILTNQLCVPGSNPLQCVSSSMTIACPGAPGQLITGFTNGQPNCKSNPPPSPCPNGQVVTSFDANGAHCTAPVSCPQKFPIRMCQNLATGVWDQFTLPAGYQGDTKTLTDGDSYTKVYTCNSSGQWQKVSTSGTCTCNPGPSTQDCFSYFGTGCSNCWSGSTTLSTTCPGGTSNYVSDTCACVNYTSTTPVPCQAGFIGTQTQSQTFTCDPNNPKNPATPGPKTITGTCVCDPTATATQSISCQAAGYGAGYSGTVTQTRSMNCGANAWGPWTTTSNTCACSPIVQYQQIGCPAPQVGTQYQSQTYDCTANTWGPWTTYSNTCGAIVHTWEMASSPSKITGSPAAIQVGQSCSTVGQTSPCSASAGSGKYYQYPICQCQ